MVAFVFAKKRAERSDVSILRIIIYDYQSGNKIKQYVF